MAEPPTRTLPHQGAGGPHGLLATKLYLPRAQPGHVPRPHLLERLRDGLARGLVLVCAPAGFGKTALLADWARDSRRPVAWLSLDEADNDPVRFWRHVTAALDRTRPGVADRLRLVKEILLTREPEVAQFPPALRRFTRLSAHSTAWSRRGTTVLHYRF